MAGWRAASPPPHRVGSRAADCRCLVILCPLLFIFSYYFFVCSVVESLKDLLDEKIVEVFREELHLSCNEHVCLIISIQCKKTVNLFKDLMFLDKQFYQCLFAIHCLIEYIAYIRCFALSLLFGKIRIVLVVLPQKLQQLSQLIFFIKIHL